jgi:hypothetical protein
MVWGIFFQKYEDVLKEVFEKVVLGLVEKPRAIAFIRMKETEVVKAAISCKDIELTNYLRELAEEAVQNIKALPAPSQGAGVLLSPEQVRENMKNAGLCILKPERQIKDHVIPAEYWQAKGKSLVFCPKQISK